MIENDEENSPILKPLEVNLVLLKMHPLPLETPKIAEFKGFLLRCSLFQNIVVAMEVFTSLNDA